MNERIRQLVKQAEQYALDKANESEEEDFEISFDDDFQEKFAELIVQECIAQCEQVATAADAKSKSKFVTDDGRMLHEGMWGGAKNCSGQIKQHFGVAE
jgi:hypothetical protein